MCQEPDCGEIFEVSRRLDDTTAVECPTCGSADTHKVILSTPLIHVSWRNTIGLGHSGQIVLDSVQNQKIQRRRKHDGNESDVQA